MRNACLPLLIAVAVALVPACYTPVPRDDWPEKDDPLFRYAVWIRSPDGLGSGALIHSSERGTYVLTAAHVAADDDGYQHADGTIEVGVWALSHDPGIREPHATYRADVVASTAPKTRTAEDSDAGLAALVDWVIGRDLAVLRLRTDRRFVAAPLFSGTTDELEDVPLTVIAIVPEMYPHRKPAIFIGENVFCTDSVDGNSGSAVFANGQVVGVGTSEVMSPGPKQLQEFIREHEEIRFLLE